MTTEENTLAAAFAGVAQRSPDQVVILAEDLELSAFNLWRVAQTYAAIMTENGVGQGQTIALDTTDTIVSVAAVLAMSLLGVVLVPYHPTVLQNGFFAVERVLRSAERPRMMHENELIVDGTWSPKSRDIALPSAQLQSTADEAPLAWIMPSSGTMGSPKYTGLARDLVMSRVKAVTADFDDSHRRCLILFAASTRPFIIRSMAALISGRAIVDTRSSAFTAASKVDTVFASPNQLDTFLGRRVFSPKLPSVQISGAKLLPKQRTRYLNSFERVDDVYGTNETIKAQITRYERDANGEKATVLPLNTQIDVVDSSGQNVPNGQLGEVRIKTPQIADGYFNDPVTSDRHFRDGWFYPGDRGFKARDGRIVLQGRDGDVLNIGGEKLSAQLVEACLQEIPSIASAVCFENPLAQHGGELAAVLELSKTAIAADIAKVAWEAVALQFGPQMAPRSALMVPCLDKTDDGVVRRAAAVSLFVEAANIELNSNVPNQLFHFRIEPNG